METCSRIVNDKKFSILLQKGTIFDTWKWESTKIDRNKSVFGVVIGHKIKIANTVMESK